MNTYKRFLILAAGLAALGATCLRAQTDAISIDRTQYFNQTAAATVAAQQMPFTFAVYLRANTTNWGPAFYKPGSGGVPQSGSSSATNTGTLNFPVAPNNGTGHMFTHDFATNAEMVGFYPIAPTDGGAYGVKFLGAGAPTPPIFTDGLIFAADTTYPSVTPQITSVNNGAVWVNGVLQLQAAGTTTLTFNAFPEYSSTPYGSFIATGIYGESGVVNEASVESYYLPLGDSTETPAPTNQPPVTQVAINGAWLTPGQNYTLELQYVVIASRPEEAMLNSSEFQGLATYRKTTYVTVRTEGTPSSGVARSDLAGDGRSDIVWQNSSTGERSVWMMNGTTVSSGAVLGTIPVAWTISGTGDFNGDGKSDLVLTNTANGDRAMWLMNGSSITTNAFLGTIPVQWAIAGTGDFNGDGKDDIVWSNTATGDRAMWLMNGAAVSGGGFMTTLATDWHIRGTGDFNGDGRADILWSNSTTGERSMWLMNGTTATGGASLGTLPLAWQFSATGDFNGDGTSDIVLTNTSTGDRAMWLMNGTTIAGNDFLGTIPVAWAISASGDYNGDGRTDIMWSNTSTGDRAMWLMNGSTVAGGGFLTTLATTWQPVP